MLDIQTDDLQDPTYSIGQAMVASVVCPGEKKKRSTQSQALQRRELCFGTISI